MTEQGEVYAAFVAAELAHERQRRDRLDSKGNATLVSTAALVGLTSALGLVGPELLTRSTVVLQAGFVVAAVLLLASAILALLGSWLHGYKVLHEKEVQRLLRENWEETQITARNRVSYFNGVTLGTLRKGNNTKARKLLWAQALQVAGAVCFVTTALGVVLSR